MCKNTVYYDIVLDETGQFLQGEEGNFNSACVGFLVRGEDGFLLTNRIRSGKNDVVELKTNNIIITEMYEAWKHKISEIKREYCLGQIPYKEFLHISEFSDARNRTAIQKDLLEFYKNELYKMDPSWQLLIFEQKSSKLISSIPNGEAATIDYLDTLAEGVAKIMVTKHIENYPKMVSFNINIATRRHKEFELGLEQRIEKVPSRIIEPKQYRRYFKDFWEQRYGKEVRFLCNSLCNFYTVDGLGTPQFNDELLMQKFCEMNTDSKNRKANFVSEGRDYAKEVTEQFLLTIADCFANGSRYRQTHQKSFFDGLNNVFPQRFPEYKLEEIIKEEKFDWDVKKALLEKDFLKLITKIIIFPKVNINHVKSEEKEYNKAQLWEKRYLEVQNKYTLVKKMLINEIQKLDNYSWENLCNILRDKIRNGIIKEKNQGEGVEQWILRLSSLLSLFKNLENTIPDNVFVKRIGVDVYLFLANRYQNCGKDKDANDCLKKAKGLEKYWWDEHRFVYALLKMNGLNDKFQWKRVDEEFREQKSKLKDYGHFCDDILSDGFSHIYTYEIMQNIGKMTSILLEAQLIKSCIEKVSGNSKSNIPSRIQNQINVGLKCFKSWEDRRYIYSNYFKLALALGNLRIAKRVFLISLREMFEKDSQNIVCLSEKRGGHRRLTDGLVKEVELSGRGGGNAGIKSILQGYGTNIMKDDFYEFNAGIKDYDVNKFKAYMYLNYLTLIRELCADGYVTKNREAGALLDGLILDNDILSGISAIEHRVYPACLIYWRLAQIIRSCACTEFANVAGVSAAYYYEKAIEVFGNKKDLRLLAIKIAIIADYSEFLKNDERAQQIEKLNSNYKIFMNGCTSETGMKDIFAQFFRKSGNTIYAISSNLYKIASVIPDYF